ncbi:hypothetical protein CLU79DRAFT_81777 [Phycomyces nitens]|nr:hypothetical protein CLU79DRAFT_81777 [Phycomyces nitens]
MEPENYYYSCKGKDKFLLYFVKNPVKNWDYTSFELHFSGGRNSPKKAQLVTNYKHCLSIMEDDKKVPKYVKKYIENIKKELVANKTSTPQFSRHQQKRHAPEANEDAHQRKRSHVMEEGSSASADESVTDTNMVETLARFLNGSDFSKFHQYRLESHGIIQVGKHLGRQPDVPSSVYDSIALEDKPSVFPISKFSNYLRSTLFSELYGTHALAPRIFSETEVNGIGMADETQFIMWTILNL